MKCPLFYLPLLHRRIAAATVPDTVLFFPTGLQETNEEAVSASSQNGAGEQGVAKGQSEPADSRTRLNATREAVKEALPFKGREALAILGEMLESGETLACGGFLRQLSANNSFMQGQLKGELKPGESAALADIGMILAAGDGQSVPLWGATAKEWAERSTAISQALIDCQKVLLLAWWHEEKLVELAGLERRIFTANQALCAALADNGNGEDLCFKQPDVSRSSEYAVVPWRVVMDAALPFLPDSAAIFTTDETMVMDMRDAGMLRPLSEDMADLFTGWPQEMLAGLLYAELPGWRLVGRKAPLAERPWLERTITVFAARPQSGWV